MDIDVTRQGGAAVVRLRGRIVDGDPELHLRDTLQKLVQENELNTIIDFEGVTWFDSLAIGVLVSHYVSTTKRGGRIIFVNANDRIHSLMQLARLDDRFEWATSVDEAIQSLDA